LMELIDLHTHSTYSDGTFTPSEIVIQAVKLGLTAIALTDHDTVAGIDEALEEAKHHAIELVSGVEISAWHGDTSLHILGYGIDHKNRTLQLGMNTVQEIRKKRNNGIIEKLNRTGIRIDRNDLDEIAAGQLGRPHFAQLLIDKGIVKTYDQAFYQYLGDTGKAFVPKGRFEAREAIRIIQDAGGMAVLAHPGCMDPSLATTPDLLRSLMRAGLEGVEVYYPSHPAKTKKKLKKIGDALGLLLTGGSDFHGHVKSNLSMAGSQGAIRVPAILLDGIKKRLETRA
ncbi:MAG: PHP domain-containing protein, partial [Desulfobulbaceae bacterium]|nr:PHP domain-containing protein [Desulfobulbaceae bacterium]